MSVGEIFQTDNGIELRCTIDSCNWSFLKTEEFSSHLQIHHRSLNSLHGHNKEEAIQDPIHDTFSESNSKDKTFIREDGTIHFGSIGIYSCELCLKKLNINENFITHKKLHTNEKNFKCPSSSCVLWFFNSEDFSFHINHDHDDYTENKVSFDEVNNKILEEIDLKKKDSSRYQNGLEACEFCNIQVRSITVLRKHKKKVHTESQLLVCKKCPRRFKEKYQIVAHLKKHVIIHSCDFCEKTFNDKYKLDVHIRRHNNIRPFECNVCKRGFPTNAEKTTHERNHTENRAFVCEICGNGFKTLQYLWVHKKTHEDKRTYVCPDCGKAFNTASVLKCHRYIHLEVKQFSCDICNKAFNKRWTLKVHKRLHFDKLYYTCDICARGFKQHGSYKAHIKSHANENNQK